MNVALHGRKDNGTLLFLLNALFRKVLLDALKRFLRCVCAHEKLRQEHRVFLKALPHFVERRDKLTVDDFQRRRRFQHLIRQLSRLLAQAFHNGAVQRNAFGRPACALLRSARAHVRRRRGVRIRFDIRLAAHVYAHQRAERAVRLHQLVAQRVNDTGT